MSLSLTPPQSSHLDPEFIKVQTIAQIYEDQLGKYLKNPTLRYLKGSVKRGTGSFTTWLRATKLADEIETWYDEWVRGNFWFVDMIAKRAPKPHELALYKTSFPSQKRVLLYQAKVKLQKPVIS